MNKAAAILLLAFAPLMAADTGAMSDTERAYLVSQLEQSKKDMLASIDGLSAAQWNFHPAPGVWSVGECAEHIILAEGYIFGASQQMLKSPAVARLDTANAEHDQGLVAAIKDRSKKGKAPEAIVPSGKYPTPADAARAFAEVRDKTIEYAKSTKDDLRAHSGQSPQEPLTLISSCCY